MAGFDERRVWFEMGQVELQYHFMTVMKLITRASQMQSSLLLNTVGSLFVKPGQKTLIEELSEELVAIEDFFGAKTEPKEGIQEPKEDAFDKLFKQFTELGRRGK